MEVPLRLRLIAALGVPALIFAACQTVTPNEPGTSDAGTGSGGATGDGSGGASAQGGSGGGTGAGGTMGTGGGAGTTGTGGHGSGGAGAGGAGGAGGSAGAGGSTGAGGATGSGGAGGVGGITSTTTSGLPLPPGASNVAKPSNAPGNITVLNWAGFKGAVTYTFDDDNDSQIANYGQLQALGVPFTFYLWTGRTQASSSTWMTAVHDGHEIGNHTQSHTSNGTTADIQAATTFITQHLGVTPWTMAAPNGAAVYTTLANGLFLINRGVADNLIAPNDNTDRFTLPCYIPPTGATASMFNAEVDSAQSAGKWRVILVHGFTGGNDSAFQPVPLNEFISGVQHTISLGNMWIGRVVDVASYWLGQKAFSQATTTMSGNNKTWAWTLPSKFPPGKFLRVTVPGGTVTQNGMALPWNSHGFYEIALDAGSVTVGP
jgi:peptidoglycan/xylan/chitin deacetylase (PgdA/CDA1 family)